MVDGADGEGPSRGHVPSRRWSRRRWTWCLWRERWRGRWARPRSRSRGRPGTTTPPRRTARRRPKRRRPRAAAAAAPEGAAGTPPGPRGRLAARRSRAAAGAPSGVCVVLAARERLGGCRGVQVRRLRAGGVAGNGSGASATVRVRGGDLKERRAAQEGMYLVVGVAVGCVPLPLLVGSTIYNTLHVKSRA
jgi:hypothetical protein